MCECSVFEKSWKMCEHCLCQFFLLNRSYRDTNLFLVDYLGRQCKTTYYPHQLWTLYLWISYIWNLWFHCLFLYHVAVNKDALKLTVEMLRIFAAGKGTFFKSYSLCCWLLHKLPKHAGFVVSNFFLCQLVELVTCERYQVQSKLTCPKIFTRIRTSNRTMNIMVTSLFFRLFQRLRINTRDAMCF